MRIIKRLSLIIGILFIFSCEQEKETNQLNSATVYSGGDIITMTGDSATYVESIVVNNGRIQFVGTKNEAVVFAGKGHQFIDLKGRTMLPGFIDAHAHFSNFSSQAIGAQILPPPDAVANNISEASFVFGVNA